MQNQFLSINTQQERSNTTPQASNDLPTMAPHLWIVLCVRHKEGQKCWLHGPEQSQMTWMCWVTRRHKTCCAQLCNFGQNNAMRIQKGRGFLVCILIKGEERQIEQPMQHILLPTPTPVEATVYVLSFAAWVILKLQDLQAEIQPTNLYLRCEKRQSENLLIYQLSLRAARA